MKTSTLVVALILVSLALVASIIYQLYVHGLIDVRDAVTTLVVEIPLAIALPFLIRRLLGDTGVPLVGKEPPRLDSRSSSTSTRPEVPSTVPARVTGPAKLTIGGIDEVIAWGWSGPRLLDELIRLDYDTIDGLTVTMEGHRQQWSPVFMDHPDTWRLLLEGPGKIVGYWHFVPLFDGDYTSALSGKLMDSEITTDKVRLFEIPGTYKVYFVSICVEARFRHTTAVRALFESLYDVVADLSKNGVFIDEVCANAYTLSGQAVCKSFGMDYVREHVDHGQIWKRHIYPFQVNDPLLSNPDIVSRYTERFAKSDGDQAAGKP